MIHGNRTDEAILGSREDPLYAEARELVLATRRPSISMVQRHLGIAYSHATRLVEAMEGDILGPPNAAGIRPLLVTESLADSTR